MRPSGNPLPNKPVVTAAGAAFAHHQRLSLLLGLCVYGATICFSLSLISHAVDLVGGLFR